MSRKHLHGDNAAHQPMLGLEDLAHATLANRVGDLVRPEIELRATDFELLSLPAIDAAEVDKLRSERGVVDDSPGANRASTGANRSFSFQDLLDREQTTG
jgi:hypothetical protein